MSTEAKAIFLVNTESGARRQVKDSLNKVIGLSANAISGPHDIIVAVSEEYDGETEFAAYYRIKHEPGVTQISMSVPINY